MYLPPYVDIAPFMLPELLLSIFDYLAQKDLLSASGTCRHWRALALAHPTFFYHFVLDADPMAPELDPIIAAFSTGVSTARLRNVRVSIDVNWKEGCKRNTEETQSQIKARRERGAKTIMTGDRHIERPSIGLQAPLRILWHFPPPPEEHRLRTIAVPSTSDSGVQHRRADVVLQHTPPARLLYVQGKRPGELDNLLPVDIFAGCAPMLRSISLDKVPTPPYPIPAFAFAENVFLSHLPRDKGADLVALFPAMISLRARGQTEISVK